MTNQKSPLFMPNPCLTTVLKEINALLGSAERDAVGSETVEPHLPLVFIVGAPRSGTTLTLQWLASTGAFSYPTNVLSRFYEAPYIGARIQQMITDPEYDYAGELTGAGISARAWASSFGKTVGLIQPHEFSFFWRRFYPLEQARRLDEDELASSDSVGFANSLGLLQRVFQKPFAAKGILLQYNLAHLARLLPSALFIRTLRDPFRTTHSLLNARRKMKGDLALWFSVEPPGIDWLRMQDPYVQVAGQVVFTNNYIERQWSELDPQRLITLRYEEFCLQPELVYEELRAKMRAFQHEAPAYTLLKNFLPTECCIEEKEKTLIKKALDTALKGWESLFGHKS